MRETVLAIARNKVAVLEGAAGLNPESMEEVGFR
jgi:hypothetical protein